MADARIIHFEVTGKDQKALQGYYSDLFGWKLNTDFPGGYGMTDPAQTGADRRHRRRAAGPGLRDRLRHRRRTSTRRSRRPPSLGGSVVMPKFSPDGNAQLALVADPEGHVLGLTEV